MHPHRNSFVAATACAILLQAGLVWGATATHFDLPAQALNESIKEVARQTNTNVLFDPALVVGLRAPALSGELTAEDAIKRLVADLKISVQSLNAKTIVLQVTPSPEKGRPQHISRKSTASSDIRVAQAGAAPETYSGAVTEANPGETGVAENSTTARLEEIVVTAQKRAERLQDVPISIVALTAEQLEKRNITDVDDLSRVVPGLTVISSGSYQRRIELRGVSNTTGNSSVVGVYLDEASVTSANPSIQLDLRTYDLDRVEVLRGPQGTLYGEGSLGGTLRFISKDPLLDRFTMNADVAALFTENGAPSQRIESAVNLPVIQDTLGLRFAGTFEHDGGWIDQPAASVRNFNSQNLTDARVKALWQPAAAVTVNAMVLIHRNEAPPNNGEDANGNFTQTFNQTTTPSVTDNYNIYNLTATGEVAALRVVETSSYLTQDKESRDIGYRYPVVSPPFNVYLPLFATTSSAFTEELRLTPTQQNRWKWTVGAYYRRALFDVSEPAVYFGFPGAGLPAPAITNYRQGNLSKSWAGFGDSNYEVTNRLTLGAGLRYYRDDEENRTAPQSATFTATSPRAYVQLKLSDQFNTYASAAKGFRSGGYNAAGQPTYGPEEVWTYEFGTKMSVFDRHLDADVAVFYSNYSQYQIAGVLVNNLAAGNIISNAGDARIKGVEWTTTWIPQDQWRLSFSGNLLHTRFYRIDATSTAYAVGDELPETPQEMFTVSAEHDFEWNGRPGLIRLDYSQTGRMTDHSRSQGPAFDTQSDIINMLNFNVGVETRHGLWLGIFAQNLLNDRGYLDALTAEDDAARPRPRTYGIDFKVKFD